MVILIIFQIFYYSTPNAVLSKVSIRKDLRLIEFLVNKLNQSIHMQFQHTFHHFNRLNAIIPKLSATAILWWLL